MGSHRKGLTLTEIPVSQVRSSALWFHDVSPEGGHLCGNLRFAWKVLTVGYYMGTFCEHHFAKEILHCCVAPMVSHCKGGTFTEITILHRGYLIRVVYVGSRQKWCIFLDTSILHRRSSTLSSYGVSPEGTHLCGNLRFAWKVFHFGLLRSHRKWRTFAGMFVFVYDYAVLPTSVSMESRSKGRVHLCGNL